MTGYPDDCLQQLVRDGQWWIEDKKTPSLGSLVKAFVPTVDRRPYTFEVIGRSEPTQHSSAEVKVAPLPIGKKLKQVKLPVAAMPLNDGELWGAYRVKFRPCLLLSKFPEPIPKQPGKANYQTARHVMVAPYYGVEKGISRMGYNAAFVERVRHCQYSGFFWDKLPIKGAEESLLRIDQAQPIGADYNSYRATGYRLCDEGVEMIEELFTFSRFGELPEGTVSMFIDEMTDHFNTQSR